MPKAANFEYMKKLLIENKAIFFGLLFLLFVGNLILSQKILAVNIKLTELRNRHQLKIARMSELKVKASQLHSTKYIIEQAKLYGFVETQNIMYLTDNDFLAKND